MPLMDVDDLSDCPSEPQGLALATDSSHEGDIAASGVVVAEDGDLSSGEDEPMVLGSAPTTGLVLADDDDADRSTRAEAESTAVWACPGDSESDPDGGEGLELALDAESDATEHEEAEVIVAAAIPILEPPAGGDMAFCFAWSFRLWAALTAMFDAGWLLKQFCTCDMPMSSHFSGLGTAELALLMLASAGRGVLGFPLRFRIAFQCEIKRSLWPCLFARAPDACLFKSVLDRLEEVVPASLVDENGLLDYERACATIMGATMCQRCHCVRHNGHCTSQQAVAGDCSGSPCVPWSFAAAKRPLGRRHPAVMLLLAWIAWVRASRPAVAIHENTPGFDCDIVMDFLGDVYIVFILRVSPAQVGFPMMRRSRLYIVCILKSARRVVRDVHHTYAELTRRLQFSTVDAVSWAFRAPREELIEEENEARARLGLAPISEDMGPSADWTYLLTHQQQGFVQKAERLARERSGIDPALDPNLVYDAGATAGLFSYPSGGSIPTFRRGSYRL